MDRCHTAEQSRFLIVQRIADGGPSDITGVEVGDIIVSVGGQAVTGQIDSYRKMWSLGGPGIAIELTVLKSGSGVKTVSVASTDRYRWLRLSKGN